MEFPWWLVPITPRRPNWTQTKRKMFKPVFIYYCCYEGREMQETRGLGILTWTMRKHLLTLVDKLFKQLSMGKQYTQIFGHQESVCPRLFFVTLLCKSKLLCSAFFFVFFFCFSCKVAGSFFFFNLNPLRREKERVENRVNYYIKKKKKRAPCQNPHSPRKKLK